MAKDFDQLDAYCAALIANLAPSQRRRLAKRIATDLRSDQSKQIAAQKNPDGTAFARRKNKHQKGRIRRTMFAKLRQRKHLKAKGSADNATVEFTRNTARIAKVHHYGLRDRVMKDRDFKVDYAERKLLGFNPDNIDQVKQRILEQLAQ